ncbi:VOC family protein [Shimia sp. R11_0]|uniref:VOC family protein n=1 Tax=Shimia sp. R11_0 TaxID=2821096 RepID=UPI001AD98886|nr:VOC family protein [Shimia sp. R11_0]MBO9479251.1 VOC family protein [Shimia sp. R11_0]
MKLEHVNVTVRDPKATAALLCDLFDWQVRWEGESIHGGTSVHVGEAESYLALYTPPEAIQNAEISYYRAGGLNHIGIVVEDLDMIEARVKAAGYEPKSHADYEPGRRFYFDGPDAVEYEVISYA